jgi:lactate dehydrogenase-like 2-hydroxyacid dehydrogenase
VRRTGSGTIIDEYKYWNPVSFEAGFVSTEPDAFLSNTTLPTYHDMAIKTVGVVGTGVIGASWTALFLAHGLRVLVADPGPDAEEKLASHLKSMWPALQQMGLSHGASLDNYTFVGASLGENYGKVDFVQEVCTTRADGLI